MRTGIWEVGILYQDDTAEHRLHRLETRLPFEETIVMEDLESGEDVRLHYETEDLNVSDQFQKACDPGNCEI